MDARIVELEDSIRILQERLQTEPALEQSLEEKLNSMQRAAKRQERMALQISKEQKAQAAAQEAHNLKQETIMNRLKQENKVLLLQAKQYERCLDEVGRRVVAALLEQKSLREEVTNLRSSVKELENKNLALTCLLSPTRAKSNPTTGCPSKESPRDEGYSTMSSDVFCTFSKCFKARGELEDLIEEPENISIEFRHSLPGYSLKRRKHLSRCKSDSDLNKDEQNVKQLHNTIRCDLLSNENMGEGLEEDCSEMLLNYASFLPYALSSRNSKLLYGLNLQSTDTIFEQFNRDLNISTPEINIQSVLTSSNSSLNSELGAVGRDFTKDFYTLVRVGSEKSFNEELDCSFIKSPEDLICSDCTSSVSSAEDSSLLQEVLSALGNHGKSGWVPINSNMDAQTREKLLEHGQSSSDNDSEIFEAI